MECQLPRERLELYLEGLLAAGPARDVEEHVQSCEQCQSLEIVEAPLGAVLRDKLGVAPASAALRRRVLEAIGAAEVSGGVAASAFAPVVDIRERWYRRALASPWTPRVAMVATLLFLMLLPFHLLNRTPVLAKAAMERHDCHAPTLGVEMQACCVDLVLGVGDVLTAPSEGERVPDLARTGLDMVIATRCNFDNVVVNQIGYRGADSRTFSLYISDQVTEQFMQLRTRSVDGAEQTRHRFDENDVTIWARGELIYFWVGPRDGPTYDSALAALMNTL